MPSAFNRLKTTLAKILNFFTLKDKMIKALFRWGYLRIIWNWIEHNQLNARLHLHRTWYFSIPIRGRRHFKRGIKTARIASSASQFRIEKYCGRKGCRSFQERSQMMGAYMTLLKISTLHNNTNWFYNQP